MPLVGGGRAAGVATLGGVSYGAPWEQCVGVSGTASRLDLELPGPVPNASGTELAAAGALLPSFRASQRKCAAHSGRS